jgi:hypothetical protein
MPARGSASEAVKQPAGAADLPGAPSGTRRVLPALLVALGVLLLGALGYGALSRTREQPVRGLVTSVEARDIGHAAAITVRTQDGRDLRFQVDPAVEMTPGHLREHMTFGQPVSVYYRRTGDAFVAIKVTD